MLPAGVGQTPAFVQQQHLAREGLAHCCERSRLRERSTCVDRVPRTGKGHGSRPDLGGAAQRIAWSFKRKLIETIGELTGEILGEFPCFLDGEDLDFFFGVVKDRSVGIPAFAGTSLEKMPVARRTCDCKSR